MHLNYCANASLKGTTGCESFFSEKMKSSAGSSDRWFRGPADQLGNSWLNRGITEFASIQIDDYKLHKKSRITHCYLVGALDLTQAVKVVVVSGGPCLLVGPRCVNLIGLLMNWAYNRLLHFFELFFVCHTLNLWPTYGT